MKKEKPAKRPRKLDPKIIRIGDIVKIIIPKFVDRVGYPKCPNDYKVSIEAKHGTAIRALARFIAPNLHEGNGFYMRTINRIIREYCYLAWREDDCGGRERTIHWYEELQYKDTHCIVTKLQNKTTGVYTPGGGHYNQTSGEDDYDPPCLENAQVHRIATLDILYSIHPNLPFSYDELKTPIYHLEKIKSGDE